MTAPVEKLHLAIAQATAPLEAHHAARLHCSHGCSACCVDELTVFAVEADVIRRHHADLLETEAPGPEGACAFLDATGACRIYAHRPYVCRTQGLPLRWIEEEDGDPVECRDICPLNVEGEPLVDLEPAECWTLGAAEGHLARMQTAYEPDSPERRVRLRDLFRRSDS